MKPDSPYSLDSQRLPGDVTPDTTRALVGMITEFLQHELTAIPRETRYDWGYSFEWMSAYFHALAEELKTGLHPEQRREGITRLKLLSEVHIALKAQRDAYPLYRYFNGYSYQSFELAGIFGNRATEARFEDYGLARHLKPGMHVLDIGANAGFMSIYAAYRYGCNAVCVEHNPHLLEIGRAVAAYLGVSERITLQQQRIQDAVFAPGSFEGIFSFAAHWTDDEGIRVQLDEHIAYLHLLLKPSGTLFFESHSNDVGDATFNQTILNIQQSLFTLVEKRVLENGSREFFVLQRR